jgi:DNA repair protein RadC
MSSMKLMDQPASQRPRERLREKGSDSLNHGELLAILLRTGLKGANVVEVGTRLFNRYRTLNALARASWKELAHEPGIGPDKAVTLVAAFALARRLVKEVKGDAPLLDTPEAVADYMREEVRLRNGEIFEVLLLNVRRRLMGEGAIKISDGTLDTILVHPREVFRPAIAASAAALILVHNHPSGDPSPSEADIKVTRDLIRAGQLLKIEVLDHVIIGRATQERPKDYVSLRELGYWAGF